MRNWLSQNLFIVLAGVCILLSLVCNDIEDTVVHHYERSIFYTGKCTYNDGTCHNKAYIDNDPSKPYRYFTIFGKKIDIPKWYYDAWHLIKIIREWLIVTALFFMWLQMSYHKYMYKEDFDYDLKVDYFIGNITCYCQYDFIKDFWFRFLKRYIIYLIICMVVIYFMHDLFYDGLFLK